MVDGLKTLDTHGLVYGSHNKAFMWHPGLKKPVLLATRNNHITSFAYGSGILFDGGYDGVVRETISSEVVTAHVAKNKHDPIFGLGILHEELVSLRESEEKTSLRLHFEKRGRQVPILNGSSTEKEPLDYRPRSLGFTVTSCATMYVHSENVTKVLWSPKKKIANLQKMTNYLNDTPKMISSGAEVYTVSCHNPYDTTDGVEVCNLNGKRFTYWKPDESFGKQSTGKLYGFTQMVAIKDDLLVVGTHDYKTHKNNFYGIEITKLMKSARHGVEAQPQLLLKNAFKKSEVYGVGNPLIILPRSDLEKLLS